MSDVGWMMSDLLQFIQPAFNLNVLFVCLVVGWMMSDLLQFTQPAFILMFLIFYLNRMNVAICL